MDGRWSVKRASTTLPRTASITPQLGVETVIHTAEAAHIGPMRGKPENSWISNEMRDPISGGWVFSRSPCSESGFDYFALVLANRMQYEREGTLNEKEISVCHKSQSRR